jgi:hypothetical protein
MTEIPDGIAALGPDVTERLEQMIREAHARQRAELGDALDRTLRIVPRPLRGVAKKVLTG